MDFGVTAQQQRYARMENGLSEWRMDFLASKTLKKQCLGKGQALKNDAKYSASNSSASHHSLAVMPADKCKPHSTPVEYNQQPKKSKVLGVDMPRTSAQTTQTSWKNLTLAN